MTVYELAILGSPTEGERQTLVRTIEEMVSDFGLTLGNDIWLYDGSTVGEREKKVAFAAAYFGGALESDSGVTKDIVSTSAPVIPVIREGGDFATDIPAFLQFSNGLRLRRDDPTMEELAACLLECIGLLRRQRRVFVSYRRIESRAAALQLHDLMTARGFDVFLDTHDIRPGDPFQDVLWHRLCDSDVLIMLDTPTYFDSKWTRQEIGRALAKDIHVLRIVWPQHQPNKLSDLAETIYLDSADLSGADGPLTEPVAEKISTSLERIRSRSVAARYLSITGKFRADVEKIGGVVECIGAHRAISVRLLDDRRLWVYPIVGIPTAETLNDIAEKAQQADLREIPAIVYDHVGIRDRWSAHLKWLDENIPCVRSIKVAEAGYTLAAWEDENG